MGQEDNPQDDVLKGLRAALLLIAIPLAAAGLIAGARLALNPTDEALVTAKVEADAHERKAIRPSAIFDHDLEPCDATMRVSVGQQVELDECYRRPQ